MSKVTNFCRIREDKSEETSLLPPACFAFHLIRSVLNNVSVWLSHKSYRPASCQDNPAGIELSYKSKHTPARLQLAGHGACVPRPYLCHIQVGFPPGSMVVRKQKIESRTTMTLHMLPLSSVNLWAPPVLSLMLYPASNHCSMRGSPLPSTFLAETKTLQFLCWPHVSPWAHEMQH